MASELGAPRSEAHPRRAGGKRPAGEAMARDQRRRLQEAMVAAVARHGFPGTTLEELVGLAGISKSTFYEHFASKEECFWAIYEAIVATGTEQGLAAFEAAEGQRGKLVAVLGSAAARLEREPEACALAIVDSLCLGAAASAPRSAAAARFEATLQRCYAEEPGRGEVSDLTIKGAVGGVRHLAYSALRAGRPAEFGTRLEELADWILAYQRPAGGHVLPSSFFSSLRAPEAAEEDERPGWGEPPDSPRSRKALSQRERIMRAVAQLVARKGYAALTVPSISATAGTSNQTFYAEFAGKQAAFLAAFEELAGFAVMRGRAAFAAQGSWPEAIAAALWALLEFIATDPLFSPLAFCELAAAGELGLRLGDRELARSLASLAPSEPPGGAATPSAALAGAIGGGIWTMIEAEVAAGRTASLTRLAPELADFALVGLAAG